MKTYMRIAGVLLFVAMPLLLLVLGDTPGRGVLKDGISALTILAYFLMLGQFYLSRSNRAALKPFKMARVIKLHKIIAYIFVSVILLHPFLIVVPRFFEAGIAPGEAFTTMITTWDSQGIILGIISWCLVLVLGLSSIFRNKLGMKYTTWRIFHGLLSIIFIVLATWHALDLGRHTDLPLSIYMAIVAGIAVLLLLRTYILNPLKK